MNRNLIPSANAFSSTVQQGTGQAETVKRR